MRLEMHFLEVDAECQCSTANLLVVFLLVGIYKN